jgi:hypothetical protein
MEAHAKSVPWRPTLEHCTAKAHPVALRFTLEQWRLTLEESDLGPEEADLGAEAAHHEAV